MAAGIQIAGALAGTWPRSILQQIACVIVETGEKLGTVPTTISILVLDGTPSVVIR